MVFREKVPQELGKEAEDDRLFGTRGEARDIARGARRDNLEDYAASRLNDVTLSNSTTDGWPTVEPTS